MAEPVPRGQADTIAGQSEGGLPLACGEGEQSTFQYRKGKMRGAL